MESKNQYTAIVKRSGQHYVALCLELNVASQGESLQDAKEQLKDAAKEYLDIMIEKGEGELIRPVDAETLREFLLSDTEKVHVDSNFAVSENFTFELTLNE